MDVGTIIKANRERIGISQRELAQRVFGTKSQSLISEYERGIKQPTPDMLERIAEALGCDLVVEFRPKG